MAYNPSNEGGTAIADVLFGDYNPGGKLPFITRRPQIATSLMITNFSRPKKQVLGNSSFGPQFEFGSGLSYTTFKYSDLKLSSKDLPANGQVNVNVTVTNNGQRAGNEDSYRLLARRGRNAHAGGQTSKGVSPRIYLEPSKSRTLTFTLKRDDFPSSPVTTKPTAEPGDFTVMVGG